MEDICGVCNKKVSQNQNGLNCDLCDKWYHCGCEKVSIGDYKILNQCDSAKWFCRKCNSSHNDTKKENALLRQEVQKLREENQMLKDRLCAIERKIEEKPSYSKEDIEKIVNDAIEEQNDKERRKSNIVLYNLPEAQSEDTEIREKYDIQTVSNIVEKGLEMTGPNCPNIQKL